MISHLVCVALSNACTPALLATRHDALNTGPISGHYHYTKWLQCNFKTTFAYLYLQDEHLDQRDTSSAEGSNADSGRGASEEGESQSNILFNQLMTAPRRNSAPRLAPRAQFNDLHLGFETPGRRLLYNKAGGSHPKLNQQQQQQKYQQQQQQHADRSLQNSPRPPPIPPHEPFVTRTSGMLPALYPHAPRSSGRHSFHRDTSDRTERRLRASPPVQRSNSYVTDAHHPVKYVDGSCSNDVYV